MGRLLSVVMMEKHLSIVNSNCQTIGSIDINMNDLEDDRLHEQLFIFSLLMF